MDTKADMDRQLKVGKDGFCYPEIFQFNLNGRGDRGARWERENSFPYIEETNWNETRLLRTTVYKIQKLGF